MVKKDSHVTLKSAGSTVTHHISLRSAPQGYIHHFILWSGWLFKHNLNRTGGHLVWRDPQVLVVSFMFRFWLNMGVGLSGSVEINKQNNKTCRALFSESGTEVSLPPSQAGKSCIRKILTSFEGWPSLLLWSCLMGLGFLWGRKNTPTCFVQSAPFWKRQTLIKRSKNIITGFLWKCLAQWQNSVTTTATETQSRWSTKGEGKQYMV